MTDYLELQVDKFNFKVKVDRLYSEEGLWAMQEDQYVRVGISDYMQQRSGDVAFAEIKPEGTVLTVGDEIAFIETIKVNISLTAPISGKVIEVNPMMETSPDVINQDPYGTGWLALIDVYEKRLPLLCIVMNNKCTAMTGKQPAYNPVPYIRWADPVICSADDELTLKQELVVTDRPRTLVIEGTCPEGSCHETVEY